MPKEPKPGEKVLAQNKKAFHDYFIEDRLEAGLVLKGTEVKSIRKGNLNLKESYIIFDKSEVFIFGMHVSPYEQGNIQNTDPLRTRKLLLNRREIDKLYGAKQRDGYTIIPLRVYLTKGKVKIEIALAKGKKLYDKRKAEAEKSAKRDVQRAFAARN